jgi:catechol-2,3-dioxygenase
MEPVARLAAVSLDTSDPVGLGRFYADLLGLDVFFESETFVALKNEGVFLTTQKVEEHQPPAWPEGAVPKQLHLELAVTDLDAGEALALRCGATKAETQPSPQNWRVFIDPAGHPFCMTTMIPDM